MVERFKAGLARWLTLADVKQALDLLFRWVGILAALAAIQFFSESRATLGSIDAIVRIDCDLLENSYEEQGKVIPPDLDDFVRWFNQEPDATAPYWVDPHDRGRFLTPGEALDAELVDEFRWAATPFDENSRQELMLPQPPLWTWDWEKGDASEEYDFALQALTDSQYGIFSVPVENERGIETKDVVVSSLVDGMYYVDDHGQVTERMESDRFDLHRERKVVEFQMHFGGQVSVVQGDLRRHFDIAYEGEGEFFNRSCATKLFWVGVAGVGALVMYEIWRVGAQTES